LDRLDRPGHPPVTPTRSPARGPQPSPASGFRTKDPRRVLQVIMRGWSKIRIQGLVGRPLEPPRVSGCTKRCCSWLVETVGGCRSNTDKKSFLPSIRSCASGGHEAPCSLAGLRHDRVCAAAHTPPQSAHHGRARLLLPPPALTAAARLANWSLCSPRHQGMCKWISARSGCHAGGSLDHASGPPTSGAIHAQFMHTSHAPHSGPPPMPHIHAHIHASPSGPRGLDELGGGNFGVTYECDLVRSQAGHKASAGSLRPRQHPRILPPSLFPCSQSKSLLCARSQGPVSLAKLT
jgi:hypothetical protein